MKNVFILGGTGLLGYHTVQELLKHDYKVSTVSLPPMPTSDLLPPEVACELGDINEMSDEQVLQLLEGKDMFIYAAGADERVHFSGNSGRKIFLRIQCAADTKAAISPGEPG